MMIYVDEIYGTFLNKNLKTIFNIRTSGCPDSVFFFKIQIKLIIFRNQIKFSFSKQNLRI